MAREIRTCGWCHGAGRYASCEVPTARPQMVVCGRCNGAGTVSVYLYPPLRKASR